MIELRSLTKRYGDVAVVDDVSFTMQPRRVTAIVGTSGSGKTTLINLMAGLDQPTEGRARFKGAAITGPVPGTMSRSTPAAASGTTMSL